jgi:hypothetical protein
LTRGGFLGVNDSVLDIEDDDVGCGAYCRIERARRVAGDEEP